MKDEEKRRWGGEGGVYAMIILTKNDDEKLSKLWYSTRQCSIVRRVNKEYKDAHIYICLFSIVVFTTQCTAIQGYLIFREN